MTGQPFPPPGRYPAVPVPLGPPGPPGRPPEAPAALLRRRHSVLGWVTAAVLGLGGLVVVAVLVFLGGADGLVLTSVLAALSFPALVAVCFWLDRYEPEPARYRLAALGWGAVVAVLLSLVLEQLLFTWLTAGAFVDTAIIAPLVEEAGKGLFLVAVVVLRRHQLHGLLDGIVYAALVGIGFAFVEDIVYYSAALNEGGAAALTVTVVIRGVISPFAHPLFTSAFGVGMGLAMASRRPAVRGIAPVAGFGVAVLLHGLWNGSTFWGAQGFFGAYGFVFLPLLVVVFAVALWARVREGRVLGAALQQTTALGWTRPEEVRWVARLGDRMSSRGYARRVGGRPAAQAMRAFQQTMTEIAFLHQRAVDGTAPVDLNHRMLELLQRADALRPYVVLPPPPRLPPPPWAGPGLPAAAYGRAPLPGGPVPPGRLPPGPGPAGPGAPPASGPPLGYRPTPGYDAAPASGPPPGYRTTPGYGAPSAGVTPLGYRPPPAYGPPPGYRPVPTHPGPTQPAPIHTAPIHSGPDARSAIPTPGAPTGRSPWAPPPAPPLEVAPTAVAPPLDAAQPDGASAGQTPTDADPAGSPDERR